MAQRYGVVTEGFSNVGSQVGVTRGEPATGPCRARTVDNRE
jgi:hypothetical protein